MKKLFLYLLALPLAFMSCSDDSSEDFIEEDQVFEKISYTSDYQQLQTYQAVVINSEKEYQDFVSKYIDDISNQTPKRSKVNFSKKSIIMVYGASNKGIDDIEKKLEKYDNDYYCAFRYEISYRFIVYDTSKKADFLFDDTDISGLNSLFEDCDFIVAANEPIKYSASIDGHQYSSALRADCIKVSGSTAYIPKSNTDTYCADNDSCILMRKYR